MDIKVGQDVTTGDTNDNRIVFSDVQLGKMCTQTFEVTAVTTGGIKFGKGSAVNGFSFLLAGKISIRAINGDVYFKSDNAANKFVGSVTL